MTEDEIIATYFRPLSGAEGLALGDDCAHLMPDILTRGAILNMDTLVAGVHFFANDPPDLIAAKALRVNLSDLAAKLAQPAGYLLSLSLPSSIGENWLSGFSVGLRRDQARFGLALWGGDTVSTPGPLSITITAIGLPTQGRTLTRKGARAGDAVLVTGTIGDSALGLRVLQDDAFAESLNPADRNTLVEHYHLPLPRVGVLDGSADDVTAIMDVSDGLALDLSRMCAAGEVAAIVDAPHVPLSKAAARIVESGAASLADILAGGDDYELLFTVPADRARDVIARSGCRVTQIGRIEAGEGVRVFDSDGHLLNLQRFGHQHR